MNRNSDYEADQLSGFTLEFVFTLVRTTPALNDFHTKVKYDKTKRIT